MKKLLLSLLAIMGVSSGALADVTYDLTQITDLKTGDRIVIVDQTTKNAMPSVTASSSGPTVSTITFDNDITKAHITSTVTKGLLFTVTVVESETSENSYQFTSCDNTTNKLYCTDANNGVRISNNSSQENYTYFTWDATNNKLKNTGRTRWLGVYNNQDWRCYTSATQTNIKATVTAFYKETEVIDATKVSAPVASVESGVYFHPFELTLSCATENAEISYQIGEGEPQNYNTPITITESCIVTVKATKAGLTDSETVILNYTIPQLGLVGVGTEDNPYSVADALKIIAYGPKSDDVFVKGLISTLTDISTEYKNATYDISDDGNTTEGNQLTVFRGKYLNGADITSANKDEFQIGCEVVVKGSLINYQGNTPEIATGNVLISIKAPTTNLLAPELSFEQTTFTVVEGDEFTAPKLINPNNLTVTYSSTDENVAIVDENSGEVVIGDPGTTTITATFAGNDEFAAGTASYTLIVTPKPVLGAITINGTVVDQEEYTFVEGSQITFASENADEILVKITDENDVVVVNEDVKTAGTYTWTATTTGLYIVDVTTSGCDDSKNVEFFVTITEKPAIDLVAEFIFAGDDANVTTMVEAGKTLDATNDSSNNMDNDLTDDVLTAGNGTTLSFTLGGKDNESHPKYWQKKNTTDKEARIYAGNNMTVTAPQGYQVSKITFTKGPGNSWYLTAQSGTLTDLVWTTTETGGLNSVVFNTNTSRTDIGSIRVEIAPMTNPVAPEVPVVTINDEAVTDFDKVIDLNESSVMVTITAPEGNYIYYKYVVQSAPAAVRAAEAANDFTLVENNVANVTVDKNGTLYFYTHHVASGLDSDVQTLAFTGETTSLTEIEGAESAASEWYDLQGRRVARPAKGGVYIRKQGSAITKLAL